MRYTIGLRSSALTGDNVTSIVTLRAARPARRGAHAHWFRRTGDDPFSSAALYTCRCGVVRSAM